LGGNRLLSRPQRRIFKVMTREGHDNAPATSY
jgi:hypothetical protein